MCLREKKVGVKKGKHRKRNKRPKQHRRKKPDQPVFEERGQPGGILQRITDHKSGYNKEKFHTQVSNLERMFIKFTVWIKIPVKIRTGPSAGIMIEHDAYNSQKSEAIQDINSLLFHNAPENTTSFENQHQFVHKSYLVRKSALCNTAECR